MLARFDSQDSYLSGVGSAVPAFVGDGRSREALRGDRRGKPREVVPRAADWTATPANLQRAWRGKGSSMWKRLFACARLLVVALAAQGRSRHLSSVSPFTRMISIFVLLSGIGLWCDVLTAAAAGKMYWIDNVTARIQRANLDGTAAGTISSWVPRECSCPEG